MTTGNGAPDQVARKPPRYKVIIVGGGAAGMAAAWHLNKRNCLLRTRHETGLSIDEPIYDIVVYEAGWRLGGKAASGRDAKGRIYEHGLHVWLGFYENAFAMMRECYAQVKELGMGPAAADADKVLAHRSLDEAFIAEPHIGVACKNRGEQWEAWTGYLPPMEGLPGTGIKPGDNPFSLAAYLTRAMALTRALIVSVIAEPASEAQPGEVRRDAEPGLDASMDLDLDADPLHSPSGMLERLTHALRNATLVASGLLLQSVTIMEVMLREFDSGQEWNSKVLDFLEAVLTATRRRLAEISNIDEHVRRKTELIELVITIAVGLYRDRVLFSKDGLDGLNGIDCRRWLLDNGARKEAVASPFITGLYDLAFCYKEGDRGKPALAAGQALRGVLRMFFTYRGSLFWRLRSGMGDAVFAPLYRVLEKSGVEFRFRHRLTKIHFSELGEKLDNQVTGVMFDRPRDRDLDKSSPLDRAGCWPQDDGRSEEPHEEYEIAASDFDAVIFAVGKEDFAACGDPLFKALPRWSAMNDAVQTIATRSAQVWLDVSTGDLGWPRQPAIISGLDPPFETWADMTHVLAAEAAWRKKDRDADGEPADRSVHYFCGALPQAEIEEARKRAKESKKGLDDEQLNKELKKELEKLLERQLDDTLNNKMPVFWTAASKEGHVCDIHEKNGHVLNFHVQANFVGSERFTLSLPGTLEKRISPLDASISNMSIAGDWTACGFEESCVEAAVMSGMLAAHAISGFPALEDIVGYDHP